MKTEPIQEEVNQKEVLSRIEKRIRTARAALEDADKLLAALKPEAIKSNGREADEHGAPKYAYPYKVPIPKDMQVQQRHIEYAAQFGLDDSDVHEMFNGALQGDTFVQYYRRKGTKWQDWDLVFLKWIRTSVKGTSNGIQKTSTTPRPTRFDSIRNKQR